MTDEEKEKEKEKPKLPDKAPLKLVEAFANSMDEKKKEEEK